MHRDAATRRGLIGEAGSVDGRASAFLDAFDLGVLAVRPRGAVLFADGRRVEASPSWQSDDFVAGRSTVQRAIAPIFAAPPATPPAGPFRSAKCQRSVPSRGRRLLLPPRVHLARLGNLPGGKLTVGLHFMRGRAGRAAIGCRRYQSVDFSLRFEGCPEGDSPRIASLASIW